MLIEGGGKLKENLDILFDLNIEDQKDMIRKNWMSHDARSQMAIIICKIY